VQREFKLLRFNGLARQDDSMAHRAPIFCAICVKRIFALVSHERPITVTASDVAPVFKSPRTAAASQKKPSGTPSAFQQELL